MCTIVHLGLAMERASSAAPLLICALTRKYTCDVVAVLSELPVLIESTLLTRSRSRRYCAEYGSICRLPDHIVVASIHS